MLFKGYWAWGEDKFVRYKGGQPKAVKPPALPPLAATPEEISTQAAKVGEEEGRRLRKRTGRRATRLTRPEAAMVPATVSRAGLKTRLG